MISAEEARRLEAALKESRGAMSSSLGGSFAMTERHRVYPGESPRAAKERQRREAELERERDHGLPTIGGRVMPVFLD